MVTEPVGDERMDTFGKAANGGPQAFDRVSNSIGASRFAVALAIVGVGLSSFAMLVYALIVLAKSVWHAFTESNYDIDGAKHLAVDLIELTDLFLLGMVLYVVGIGMYQLFINADIPLPGWMRVSNLDDLKTQLINVTIVLLAITFLATIVDWDGEKEIVYLGASLSAVIIALAAYVWVHDGRHDRHE